MADDPNTKAGRAKMLDGARKHRRDAEDAHEVDVWSGAIDDIQDLQRKSGDK